MADDKMKVKGSRERIKTKEARPLLKSKEFKLKGDLRATAKKAAKEGDMATLKKLKSIASKVFKAKQTKKFAKSAAKKVPLLGGIATAIATGETEAAVPILGEADRLGPKKGSIGAAIEDPSIRGEARRKLIERARKQNKRKK